jgi:hypothetical protein
VFVENVGKGIYWPSEDDNNTSETRKLIGEIPLAVKLVPSFVFPRITIRVGPLFCYCPDCTMTALTQYQVTFALMAPGFDSESSGTFSREVEIATVLAPGPIPLSRVPATHQHEHSGDL